MSGFSGNGAVLMTFEAERAGLALGGSYNRSSLWLGEPTMGSRPSQSY